MKRLCRNYKTASDELGYSGYYGESSSTYPFVESLEDPYSKNSERVVNSAEQLAQDFKDWFVLNWVNEGKDINQLKYIGLMPESIFDSWAYSNSNKYLNLFPATMEQAKFLLRSERILK